MKTLKAQVEFIQDWREWDFATVARHLKIAEPRLSEIIKTEDATEPEWQVINICYLETVTIAIKCMVDFTSTWRHDNERILFLTHLDCSKDHLSALLDGSNRPTKGEFRNIQKLFHGAIEKATRERLKTLGKLRYHKNEIANSIGVGPAQINRYETGEIVPTHSRFLLLEKFFQKAKATLMRDHIDLSHFQFLCSKAKHMGPNHKVFAEAALDNAKRKPAESLKMGNGLQFRLHVITVEFEDDSKGHIFSDLTTAPPEFFILVNDKLNEIEQRDVFLSELIGHLLQQVGFSRRKAR